MAGDIPPILIDVQLEMTKVKGQLDTLQNEIKQIGSTAKNQESKVGGLEGKLGKLAGSFKTVLGVAAVGAVFTASAKAAAEEASSLNLLNQQLELSVGATDAQKDAVNQSIAAMQEASGVADDDIRPAFANLVRGTKDIATAQNLTTLALDAAAAKGKDVTTVANALAKAHNGNTKQLGMLFPELKNSKDMMGDLAKETKGMAETAADADPMKRLNVMMDELKETLGKALLPVLRMFTRILKPLMPIIEMVAETISYLAEAFMPLVEAILDAVMPAFKAIIGALKPILEKLLPPLIKLFEKILIPILLFLSDVLIQYVVPYLEKLAEVIGQSLTWIVDGLSVAFENLMKVLTPFWENILKPIVDSLMAMMGIKVEPVIKPKVDDSALATLDYSQFGNLGKVSGSGAAKKKGKAAENPAVTEAKEVTKLILKAQGDYQKATAKAQSDYQKAVLDRVTTFKQAFADATNVNVASIWSEGYQSAEMMIEALKDKIAASKQFSADIAGLAAKNYSLEFINQLQSLGPVVGDQMAQALLTGTPEVQAEIQALFGEANLISTNGVNRVAQSLIPTFTDLTDTLGRAMVNAATDLTTALGTIKNITAEQIIAALKITTTGKVYTPKPDPTPVIKTPKPTPNPVPDPKPTITIPTVITNPGASSTEIANAIVNVIKFNNPLNGQSSTITQEKGGPMLHAGDLNWSWNASTGVWSKNS